MATKSNFLFPAGKQNTFVNATPSVDNRHQNLNLNHNHVVEEISHVQTSTTSGETNGRRNDSSADHGHGHSRSGLNSKDSLWNKNAKGGYLRRSSSSNSVDRETNQKQLSKHKTNSNKYSSTLSLHIAAYEKSIVSGKKCENRCEVDEEKVATESKQHLFLKALKDIKEFFLGQSPHANVEEIIRRYEEETLAPETMVFKQSEKLLDLNKFALNVEDRINQKPSVNFCVLQAKNDVDPPKFILGETGNIRIIVPSQPTDRNYKKTQCFNGCDITLEFKGSHWLVTGKQKKLQRPLFSFTITKADEDISVNLNKMSAINSFEAFKIHAHKIVVNGYCSANNVLLDSSTDIRCDSMLYADSVQMIAKRGIWISPEVIIRCNSFETKSDGPFWLYGRITSQDMINVSKKQLKVNIDSKFLHINQTGAIGCEGDEKICSILEGKILCSLRNFGRIIAKDSVELYVKQIDSIQANKDDTAHRALEAFKNVKGNEANGTNFYQDVQKWHRGTISAKKMRIEVDGNCDDLAQIKGDFVTLGINGSAVCEADSTWEVGISDMNVSGSLTFAGHVYLNGGKIKVSEKFHSFSTSNFGVSSSLALEADELMFAGLWKINKKLILDVRKNCIFAETSVLQVPVAYGNIGQDTVISGSWLLHSLYLKTLNLLSAESSVLYFNEAIIDVDNLLCNNSKWIVEKNLELSTCWIQQSNDASITVKEKATIKGICATKNGWNGEINASNLVIHTYGELKCNAKVKAEKCEIHLLETDSSEICLNPQLIIENDFEVKSSPLYVFGDNHLSTEELKLPDPEGRIMPKSFGLTINGKLYAQALYAERVALRLGSCSKLHLDSDKNVIQQVDLVFDVGYLHTEEGSKIIATSTENVKQQFQVSTKWLNEGSFCVTSLSALFVAGSIINKGRLRRGKSKSLSEAFFKVDGFFYNYSKLRAESIYMKSGQFFENFGKIKCSNEFECVDFQNIANHGLIETKQCFVTLKEFFVNNSHWVIENDFKLITEFIEQSTEGGVSVDGSAIIKASESTEAGWNGSINASQLFVKTDCGLKCNANVKTNFCELKLDNENANFEIANVFEVKSPLYVNGDNQLLDQNLDMPEVEPTSVGLTISGKLFAKALYAENVAIDLTSGGKMFFKSDKQFEDGKSLAVIIAGCLNTHPLSEIVASSSTSTPLQFIFNTKWFHEGAFKSSNSVFKARSIVNKGHFLPLNEHDFPTRVFETVKSFWNYSDVTGGKICLKGKGILKNFGKIKTFGEDQKIGAKFYNIINHGQISSDIITMSYVTSENATLDGIVDAADMLTIDASKTKSFDFKCTSGGEEHFMLPSLSLTVFTPSPQINVPVLRHSDGKTFTTFAIDKQMNVLKAAHFSTLVVQDLKPNSDKVVNISVGTEGGIEAETGILEMSSKEVFMKFDGKAHFKRFITGVSKINFNGKEKVVIERGFMDNAELVLQNLSDFNVGYIGASTIDIPSKYEVNLKSCFEQSILRVQKSFSLDGSMNIYGNLMIASPKAALGYVNGNL